MRHAHLDSTPWLDVVKRGAGKVLADAVRRAYGIPDGAAQGKSAEQLLSGVAHLKLLGGDPRSIRAWRGLEQLQADMITRRQFTEDFADGSDVA